MVRAMFLKKYLIKVTAILKLLLLITIQKIEQLKKQKISKENF